MGGPSFHKEQEHEKVFELYNELLKKHGELSSRLPRKMFYEEISDITGYAVVTVRMILNSRAKKKKHHVFNPGK
jgi:hypothetical protein